MIAHEFNAEALLIPGFELQLAQEVWRSKNLTKILVVDDEKKIVDIVTAYLIAQKFEVEVAYSGTEALTKFYKWQPNLVVLDLMLPDLDGNEVTRRIRQEIGRASCRERVKSSVGAV